MLYRSDRVQLSSDHTTCMLLHSVHSYNTSCICILVHCCWFMKSGIFMTPACCVLGVVSCLSDSFRSFYNSSDTGFEAFFTSRGVLVVAVCTKQGFFTVAVDKTPIVDSHWVSHHIWRIWIMSPLVFLNWLELCNSPNNFAFQY